MNIEDFPFPEQGELILPTIEIQKDEFNSD